MAQEFLKRIRQIGTGTNRLVIGKHLSASSQPSTKRFRIPAGMPNGQYTGHIAFYPEINSVFETWHLRLANKSGFLLKKVRILFDTLKQCHKFGVKSPAQTRLPRLIPIQCLKVNQVGRRFEPRASYFQPNRLGASSRTCSKGIPSLGFLLNSSACRSSSDFCSGVSSSSKSPNSKSISSTSSRRSASGIRRNPSRISDLPMKITLPATKLFASA